MKNQPRVLITGGAGFIGNATIDLISKLDFDIIATDGLLNGTYPPAFKLRNWKESQIKNPNVSFLVGDLRDKNFVKSLPR
jgi:nucleoside-diphosphate-sugar epimerase